MSHSQEQPLYYDDDAVVILDDSSFVGKDCKIKSKAFINDGILKVYAPWCPHCQSKVECLNKLAELLKSQDITIYVIDSEDNPIFAKHFANKIQGFPTFLEVTPDGYIGDRVKNKKGESVYSVPDIVSALCGHNKDVCKYIVDMEKCSKGE